ncbi:MAG: indole-3-glycerol phosphate synthase TrpC [Ignavibacteriota bacterium]
MNILKEILETKREEVKSLKKKYSVLSFQEMEFFSKSNLGFKTNLETRNHISIIAEIKKASPSKGVIKKDFNHLIIAETYMKHSVDAISVLTDEKYFAGKIEYLQQIASIKTLPLLRKDFIIDEFQIFESKAFGADLILLIAGALTKSQIRDFTQTASEIGLEVLLEIHSADELKKIDLDLNKLIGINNRDLKNFNVDINTTINLNKLLPSSINVISESGINSKTDIDLLKVNKVNGILMGEHLMRSENLDSELILLKEWCASEG